MGSAKELRIYVIPNHTSRCQTITCKIADPLIQNPPFYIYVADRVRLPKVFFRMQGFNSCLLYFSHEIMNRFRGVATNRISMAPNDFQ